MATRLQAGAAGIYTQVEDLRDGVLADHQTVSRLFAELFATVARGNADVMESNARTTSELLASGRLATDVHSRLEETSVTTGELDRALTAIVEVRVLYRSIVQVTDSLADEHDVQARSAAAARHVRRTHGQHAQAAQSHGRSVCTAAVFLAGAVSSTERDVVVRACRLADLDGAVVLPRSTRALSSGRCTGGYSRSPRRGHAL